MKLFHERETPLKRSGEVGEESGKVCPVDLVMMEVFLLCVIAVTDVVGEKPRGCLGW